MIVKGIVVRIEGDLAVMLLGEEGLEIRWPLNLLPEAQVNDLFSFSVRLDVPASEVEKMTPKSLIECLAGKG